MIITAFVMSGCADFTGDTTYDSSTDNSVNIDRSHTVRDSNGTTTYYSAKTPNDLTDDEIGDGVPSDVVVGDYDPNYSKEECGQAGFFFCPLENKCLNQPAYGSSCSG